MRIGGGVERWMALLPLAGACVLVTVYFGGPERTVDLVERALYDGWSAVVLLLRR